MATIRTYSGKLFDILNPDPDLICIEDIAHSLANSSRFNGHTPSFYSIAEHSIFVAYLCPEQYKFEGLMHDASEAFVGDMVKPLKVHIQQYIDVEDNVYKAIALKFNLPYPISEIVKKFDVEACKKEKHGLFDNGFVGLLPEVAEKQFLEEFKCLKK